MLLHRDVTALPLMPRRCSSSAVRAVIVPQLICTVNQSSLRDAMHATAALSQATLCSRPAGPLPYTLLMPGDACAQLCREGCDSCGLIGCDARSGAPTAAAPRTTAPPPPLASDATAQTSRVEPPRTPLRCTSRHARTSAPPLLQHPLVQR